MAATKLFGTDGIRGEANAGVMSPETAFKLGAALAYQARRRLKRAPRIVIGKDTRVSGYLFETALSAGVCSMGGRVLLSAVLPTPAIAHITQSMRADAGLVISASHNSFEDNGLKIFGPDGFKLPDEAEAELESLMESDVLETKRPTGMHVGRAERLYDAWGRYVSFVKATFPSELSLQGMRIIVDAAHGAAYRVAPAVFEELGANVTAIGVKPNGRNINAKCGAMHPEHAAGEVKRRSADIGIALDGDADRVIVIDDKGREIDGDAVMALCATRMIRAGKLKKRTLVATVMSNLGLEHALAREKGKLLRCNVGDRYVVEAMRKNGLNLGGEQSGHLIFLDHATTGDGLVAALQLLAIVLEEGKPLSELASQVMERVPQILLNVKLTERRPLESLTHATHAIHAVEKALGKDGRVLVRWSGTEPKLRVMVEGPNPKKIEAFANDIIDATKRDYAQK